MCEAFPPAKSRNVVEWWSYFDGVFIVELDFYPNFIIKSPTNW